MGISRSTFYDESASATDNTAIVEAMSLICDEFEHYGWRRVRAALRQRGMIVTHKKIRRLMREHDLQPRARRRFTKTTDSDHDQPMLPDLARDMVLDKVYREHLTSRGLKGSMGRRGNPYNNAKAESFMKHAVAGSHHGRPGE